MPLFAKSEWEGDYNQASQETCQYLTSMMHSGVKASELVMKKLPLLAIWVGTFSLFTNAVNAQVIADSLWLDEIRVKSSRVEVQDAYQSVNSFRVDSSMLVLLESTSISDALQFYTPLFIRNNGPGGLATVTSRGFSSSQTQVLWNGFQLNHSMLGVTDLSIIPIITVSELLSSSGTGNTSFGDKGGGTISLRTKEKEEGGSLVYQFGSFGEQRYSIEAGFSRSIWNVSVLAGFQQADNDFEYTAREFSNEAGGFVDIIRRRMYNYNESATGLISLGVDSEFHAFETKLWVLDSENEIPGGINSVNDSAKQNDGFIRWLTSWKHSVGKHRFSGALYLASQELDYIDENASINSLSDIQTTSIDLSVSSSLHSSFQLISAIRGTRGSVSSSEYPADVSRDEFALNLQSIWAPTNFLFVYPSVSWNYYSDFGSNYTANLGFNAEVLERELFLKANVSRNFIAPTFNDLYWPGLGDPELDPENVLKLEASILHQIRRSNFSNEVKVLGYLASVENGIRWLPNGNGQSSPQNIEELSLSGVELSTQSIVQKNHWTFSGGVIATQVLASISEERFEDDGALDRQLIYTPEWQYKANASISYKRLSTALFYSYVDERFTTSDHSSPFDPLPAFNTLDWVTTLGFGHRLASHSIQLSIRNAMDEEYAIILNYPMPGTHYKISIKTNF